VAASKRAVAFRLEDPAPEFDQLVQIGQGSSGLVFSAVSTSTGRSVAIKKLDMGKQVPSRCTYRVPCLGHPRARRNRREAQPVSRAVESRDMAVT
jgi:hypothetical protein